jgi:hypothetical protein
LTPPGELTPRPQEVTDMITIRRTATGATYTLAPGYIKHHSSAHEAGISLHLTRQTAPLELDDEQLKAAYWDMGMADGTDPTLAGLDDLRDPITVLAALPHGGMIDRRR